MLFQGLPAIPPGCGGIPGPWAAKAWRGGAPAHFRDFRSTPGFRGLPGLPGASQTPPRGLQGLPGPPSSFRKELGASDPPRGLPGPSRGPPKKLRGCQKVPAHVVSLYGSHALFEGPAKFFSRASQDPGGLHLLSPVKGPLLAHRAFQSKNHKFREPRDLTNFGSQLTLSTVVILPTPPCKAEKLRLRQRAAARYPCVRASPKIQFNRHRVSERAAPSRERPTPSWPSRSLLVQDASSSGGSKSIYLRKYRNE